uniref:R-spondin-3 n=1 Tax=Canis lupus familiaris TaxID=9615 RepID=A0A8C0MUG9_CANLF
DSQVVLQELLEAHRLVLLEGRGGTLTWEQPGRPAQKCRAPPPTPGWTRRPWFPLPGAPQEGGPSAPAPPKPGRNLGREPPPHTGLFQIGGRGRGEARQPGGRAGPGRREGCGDSPGRRRGAAQPPQAPSRAPPRGPARARWPSAPPGPRESPSPGSLQAGRRGGGARGGRRTPESSRRRAPRSPRRGADCPAALRGARGPDSRGLGVHPNVSQGCQGGCATCSDYNGCLSCKPRLFFVLERIGMKQIGVCLSSCPSGYYGTRYPDINKCTKCKADCDTCFNKNFCTKCKSGFYLHLGKCLDNCPEGLEANNHTMECVSIVHCEASEWSPWSPCMKKGKTCGFKRGTETRVREITQHPSAKGNLCPPTSETRKCTVQRKKCQKGERGKKGRERKRKKPNKEESKDAVPDNKGLEPSRETPEPRENKDKQQQKKRKVQDKQQKSVSVSTGH